MAAASNEKMKEVELRESSFQVSSKDTMQKPKLTAFAWKTILLAAIGGILFGYDMGVINGVLTLDGFRQTMGWPAVIEGCGPDKAADPMYVSVQTSWITSSLMIGCFVASPLAGLFSDKMGRWKTVLLGTLVFFLGGALQTGSTGLPLMISGRTISGLSIGILSTVVPLYIAETAPTQLRGSLVTLQQAGITFGFLVAFCVNVFVQKVIGHGYDWRLALGLQCVIALFMLIGLAFMPESPRYLALKGNSEQAKLVLQKLRGKDNEGLVETEFSEIMDEVSQSKANQSTWKEVFSRKLALCLLVGGFIPSISQLSGINAIMLYSSTIFNDLCIPGLVMTAVIGVVNFVFTFVSIFLSDRLGRKPLLITGATGMFFALIISAVVLWTQDYLTNTSAANGVVFLILYFIANYASTWGCIASWVVPSEVFPIRVRGKAIGLATMGNWGANVIVAFITPILMRPDVANVSGTFMFFAVCMFIGLLFVVFMYPETKGVPLEEMEERFTKPLTEHIRTNISELRGRKPAPKECVDKIGAQL